MGNQLHNLMVPRCRNFNKYGHNLLYGNQAFSANCPSCRVSSNASVSHQSKSGRQLLLVRFLVFFMDNLHPLNAWQRAEGEDKRQSISFLKGTSYCLSNEGPPFAMEEVD